jgi:hypothetical protein
VDQYKTRAFIFQLIEKATPFSAAVMPTRKSGTPSNAQIDKKFTHMESLNGWHRGLWEVKRPHLAYS